MFLGCSEISKSVVFKRAKYWNQQDFLSAMGDLLSFSVPGEREKNCWVVVC